MSTFKKTAMKINSISNYILGNNSCQNQRKMTIPLSYPKDVCSFGASTKETKRKNYEEDKKAYESRLKENPRTAFLYSPDITQKRRMQLADENPNIYNILYQL